MERVSVSSSNIASVGYDEETKVLEVEFHSGAVYQYLNVEQIIYNDMIGSSSVGKYFIANVKDSYSFIRI